MNSYKGLEYKIDKKPNYTPEVVSYDNFMKTNYTSNNMNVVKYDSFMNSGSVVDRKDYNSSMLNGYIPVGLGKDYLKMCTDIKNGFKPGVKIPDFLEIASYKTN